MERKDMIKKIEAGESLVDICIEKYREVQCKITNEEDFGIHDIGVQTCALCYKHNNMRDRVSCTNCALLRAGHPCNDDESNWLKVYNLVRQREFNEGAKVTKKELHNAIDDMISDLKDAKEYEDGKTPEESKEEATKRYIEGERDCGLAVGDTVEVTRTAKKNEQGWNNSWNGSMLKPGETGTINCVESDGEGIHLSSGFSYPYFVLEKVEKTYHVGQKFKHSGDSYILAQISEEKVALINLTDGNRWTEGKNVQEFYHITEKELNDIINDYDESYVFELIEEEE